MEEKKSESLNQKLDGLDDHLEPLEEPKNEPKDEPKDVVLPEDKPDTTDQPSEKEEEYTITDGEEDEPEPQVPAEATKSKLTPEQSYIVDNISPITVTGLVGDSDKVQSFQVLDPSQLPVGFKFIDDRDRALAVKAFAMLETQAERLQNDFRNQESSKAATDFKEREDNADRSDIGKLQSEGDLPKFKAKPGSKDFDVDPATVQIQEVLDFKEKTNQRYTEEYNAGRPYKHIGFEEAFRMYKRENPIDKAQAKEDAERGKIAERNQQTKGSAEEAKTKARVHSGTSSRDLDALIDSLDW